MTFMDYFIYYDLLDYLDEFYDYLYQYYSMPFMTELYSFYYFEFFYIDYQTGELHEQVVMFELDENGYMLWYYELEDDGCWLFIDYYDDLIYIYDSS
jgi:hypothetical protein